MARPAAELQTLSAACALRAPPRGEGAERMPAKVAHDLLGIVTIIQGFAELLPELDGRRQAEVIAKITRSCRRLAVLVERSLTAEAVIVRRQRVQLAGFLRDCLDGYSLRAKEKGIGLRLVLGEATPVARFDPDSVERILGNLVENALKFSRPPSTVAVLAQILDGHLELAVEDEGPGIRGEEIASLFDEHRIGSARPTGGERSSGLGLSIVRDLVKAHGGTIGVRSQLGGGSTFSIRLPLAPDLEDPVPLPILVGG